MPKVKVRYEGGHNFEWDAHLEEISGKMRDPDESGVDFDTMVRTITFEFDDDNKAGHFVAAVFNAFPDFEVKIVSAE